MFIMFIHYNAIALSSRCFEFLFIPHITIELLGIALFIHAFAHHTSTRFKVLFSTYFISSTFNFFCFLLIYFHLLSFILTFHVLSSSSHHESIPTTSGL